MSAPDHRKPKAHRSYTVREAARLLDVAPKTVRRWTKGGLPVLTEKRPALIRGDDLTAFVRARRPAKARCELDECYCMACRKPTKAVRGEVLLEPCTPTNGNIHAECAECGRATYKRVRFDRLDELRALGVDAVVVGEAPARARPIVVPPPLEPSEAEGPDEQAHGTLTDTSHPSPHVPFSTPSEAHVQERPHENVQAHPDRPQRTPEARLSRPRPARAA